MRSLLLLLLLCNLLVAQDKFYSRVGDSSDEANSYYGLFDKASDKYEIIFMNSGNIFFKGGILEVTDKMKDFVFTGTCEWYYKNGQLQSKRSFNSTGKEDGTSIYYYEDGTIQKEEEFKNGRKSNSFHKVFDKDGVASEVFTEDFSSNRNDWDLFKSDKSEAHIEEGKLILESFTKDGTSRFISVETAKNFTLSARIKKDGNRGIRSGLIYGFRDWNNYHYFLLGDAGVYIGSVFEGVQSEDVSNMYVEQFEDEYNELKILRMSGNEIFSVNGEIAYKRDIIKLLGINVGLATSAKSKLLVDELELVRGNVEDLESVDFEDKKVKKTGSGLVVSKNGYVLTNHHVVKDENGIGIEIIENDVRKTYQAEVITSDKTNDLAILKIKDYNNLAEIPFGIISQSQNIGSSVFTLGFPMAINGMGKDFKFTDGKISSKTGYEGALNSYQSTIPVQPGNSGGPVFNEKGQLVGVINAKIFGADNVSYIIKSNYIQSMFDVLNDFEPLKIDSKISDKSLEDQIIDVSPFVVLIKVL